MCGVLNMNERHLKYGHHDFHAWKWSASVVISMIHTMNKMQMEIINVSSSLCVVFFCFMIYFHSFHQIDSTSLQAKAIADILEKDWV